METFSSPWIAQLKKQRKVQKLDSHKKAQITVIGAGIAGVTTSYFILKNTNLNVLLVEGGLAAHGATGHNAGQIVSYFEQQISELVKQYGLEKTAKAQASVDSAWLLMEEIFADAKLKTPISQFTGYAGCQDLEEILIHLENIVYSQQANINIEPMIIAKETEILKHIPKKYDGLYSILPHKDVLALLESDDEKYVAVISARKGCTNSALFCEELIEYLETNFPDRFSLYEETMIEEVVLYKEDAVLKTRLHEIHTEKVVLCTNGFEKFVIKNMVGADIDKNFHHLVKGSVGYMAGYLEDHSRSPIAISYLPNRSNTGNEAFDSDPYFYLTRRTFEGEQNQTHSLICIGGPESLMDDTNNYKKEHPYPEEVQKVIDTFLHKTYKYAPKKIHYKYKWHGLMGYTPNGVRCVGSEPLNNVLLYNLGCNGVGILPSIYGSKRISQILKGEDLEPSIFDPVDYRV